MNGGIRVEILKVTNLCKTYNQGDLEVKALDCVSFSVHQGEFVAIVGASGSGKSTLLHLLGGVETPTSGSVTITGTQIFDLNESNLAIFRRRQIGLVYQFYNLIPTLTVKENITLPLRLDNKKPDETVLNNLTQTLGLDQRLNYLPHQLSGGQQQRVSIGRALVHQPALVLADEPTGNLDRKNSDEIMNLFMFANRQYKQTILMITHDEQIAAQADRIIYLEDGRLAQDEVMISCD